MKLFISFLYYLQEKKIILKTLFDDSKTKSNRIVVG